jgi:cell division control protein 24
MSGSTAYTNSSSTSLSSMTSFATLVPPQVNGGPVQATNNIINQRADASRSLYQICVNLRQRLAQVPGFDAHLNDSDDEDEGEDMDPVSSLWRCLRKGIPLITIYNALQPTKLLQVDEKMPEAKRPKAAAFKFVAACMKDLNLPPGECFALTDLFGDDTTGFVKVCPNSLSDSGKYYCARCTGKPIIHLYNSVLSKGPANEPFSRSLKS